MKEVLNATDVRKEWGKFIDTVVHEKPSLVKRNRDHFLALSIKHTKALLSNLTFNANIMKEADGSITATLDNIDLVVNRPNEESAMKALVDELIEYTNDYFENFSLYFNSTNRQAHFPYVLMVGVQDNSEDVARLINA